MEIYWGIFKYVIEIVAFLILMFIFDSIFKQIKRSNNRIFNPTEYFPEEEVHTLRQIFYLIMMGFFFMNILYTLIFINTDIIYFVIFDIILSLYLAIELDKSTLKNKILLLLLIPYGSLTFVIFGNSLIGIMDIIHIPVFIYFIKVYYDKFMEYTKSNGLGITIIILFTLIFLSFFATQLSEHVNPLDSLVMVSNAFTSNGYAVLGKTILGKINSVFLVWGGYLLSGVGTATLASGILIRHYSNKIKEFEEKFDEVNGKLDNLEELIKENNKD